MTRNLIEEYKLWGLEVKTKYLCTGGQQQNLILEDGTNTKFCIQLFWSGDFK